MISLIKSTCNIELCIKNSSIIYFACTIFSIFSLEAEEHIKLGRKNWLLRSLDVTTFKNGDIINEAHNRSDWIDLGNSHTPAFCSYEFDSNNDKIYGKLYNIFALIDKRQLLVPSGYHIPLWDETLDALDNIKKNKYSIDTHKNRIICINCKKWSDKYRKLIKCNSCKNKRYITAPNNSFIHFNEYEFGCYVNQNGEFYKLDYETYFQFLSKPGKYLSSRNFYSIGFNIRVIKD
jgi:uncharacterized protein (TIGR02145 family)